MLYTRTLFFFLAIFTSTIVKDGGKNMLVGDILIIIYSIVLSIAAVMYSWDNMKLEEEIEDLEEELKQKENRLMELTRKLKKSA